MHKNKKGGPDPGNGAAGPESKQNKGFGEGPFGAKMHLPHFFHLWGPKREMSPKSGHPAKMCKFR